MATKAITLLPELSYRPGVVGCLIGGEGYWLEDRITHVMVEREDGKANYRVNLAHDCKPCSCDCPDSTYRRRNGQCKHGLAVTELLKNW